MFGDLCKSTYVQSMVGATDIEDLGIVSAACTHQAVEVLPQSAADFPDFLKRRNMVRLGSPTPSPLFSINIIPFFVTIYKHACGTAQVHHDNAAYGNERLLGTGANDPCSTLIKQRVKRMSATCSSTQRP